jgi:hypothetical protein
MKTLAGQRNTQLARIVESCLESEAAYKLFDMLSAVADLDVEAKQQYIELVRESGAYTEEEIHAIERLVLNGAARFFKDAIDHVRQECVQREIDDMLQIGTYEG